MIEIILTKRGCKLKKNDNILPLREPQILPVINAMLLLYYDKLNGLESNVIEIDSFLKVERDSIRYIVTVVDNMFVINEEEIIGLSKRVNILYEKVFEENDKIKE